MKRNKTLPTLTKAEEEVMHIIWELGRCMVRDVIDKLGDPDMPHSTVSSVVRILEKEGLCKPQGIWQDARILFHHHQRRVCTAWRKEPDGKILWRLTKAAGELFGEERGYEPERAERPAEDTG